MSLVMIKPSQLSPFAFTFDIACRPAGKVAVADMAQQYVHHTIVNFAAITVSLTLI